MRLVKLLGLSAVFVVLAVAASKTGSVGLAQAGCTVTVKPGESIQKAIDEAPAGAAVCLAEGTWEENIKISKGLTLQGKGKERTLIKGKDQEQAVLSLVSPNKIHVSLKDFTVEGTFGAVVGGQAEVTFSDIKTLGNQDSFFGRFGIGIRDEARATMRNSFIQNHYDGLIAKDAATVNLTHTQIADNEGDGLWLEDNASVIIHGSQIINNRSTGITVLHSAKLDITQSEIAGNFIGIEVADRSQFKLIDSTVASNEWCGLFLWSSASIVYLKDNIFYDNKGCGTFVLVKATSIQGTANTMRNNWVDLCGFAPSGLRKPLVAQAQRMQISVPQDFPTIQEAVDAVAPGGTVLLSEGVYHTGVTLWKPMTLRGVGRDKTILQASERSFPIISIIPEAHGVEVGNLSIRGNKSTSSKGILIYDGITVIDNIQASGWEWAAVEVRGSATLRISNSEFSQNEKYGIEIWTYKEPVFIEIWNTKIAENEIGLDASVEGPSSISIANSTLSKNRFLGAQVVGSYSKKATPVRVHLYQVEASDNRATGLEIRGLLTVTIDSSRFERNGDVNSWYCQEPYWLCSGVVVRPILGTRYVFSNSMIRNSADWGLAAMTSKCGYGIASKEAVYQSGEAVFLGNNVIEGNNILGKRNGMGNPGHHPWNRLGVPDGKSACHERRTLCPSASSRPRKLQQPSGRTRKLLLLTASSSSLAKSPLTLRLGRSSQEISKPKPASA